MAGNASILDASALRLSVYQKTKIDLLRESVPKPPGYLPPKYLPTWEVMPLEQKLPCLPAPPGALDFTRGKLGKSLLRTNVMYSLSDPMNRERIPSDKYEALHDPQIRINENQYATDFLKQHGAVNENGEVICTLKEFNRYRKYLATIYNDKVRQKLHEMDQLQDFERVTARALLKEELTKKGQGKQAIRNERILNAKKFIEQTQEQKQKCLRMKVKLEEQRRLVINEEKKREQAEKVRIGEAKRAMIARKLEEKRDLEVELRKEVLHKSTLRDMISVANKEHVKNNKKILHEKSLSQWFEAKTLSAAERLHREKEMQEIYGQIIKKRAIKRQKWVENFRAGLPMRIAKRLAEKERLDRIVRKYAMRWLNKVRERLYKPIDELHESLWYSANHNCLVESVRYLYDKSGYEKLDDVVMNILKFKEALKKQLQLEEDDEEYDEDDYLDE